MHAIDLGSGDDTVLSAAATDSIVDRLSLNSRLLASLTDQDIHVYHTVTHATHTLDLSIAVLLH